MLKFMSIRFFFGKSEQGKRCQRSKTYDHWQLEHNRDKICSRDYSSYLQTALNRYSREFLGLLIR